MQQNATRGSIYLTYSKDFEGRKSFFNTGNSWIFYVVVNDYDIDQCDSILLLSLKTASTSSLHL